MRWYLELCGGCEGGWLCDVFLLFILVWVWEYGDWERVLFIECFMVVGFEGLSMDWCGFRYRVSYVWVFVLIYID